MYESVRFVVLRTVRYDDRHSIATVWSNERGRLGLLVPASTSASARRMRGLMMPLSLLEGQVDIRPGRELYNIKDVRPMRVLSGLYGSPAKSMVAMFVSEVLERILRDMPPEGQLAEFIFASVECLEEISAAATANFPIVFMVQLGRLLGIAPPVPQWNALPEQNDTRNDDVSRGESDVQDVRLYRRVGSCVREMYFDMDEGIFRRSMPMSKHILTPPEARVAASVLRLDYRTACRLRLPQQIRRQILDKMLEYYSLHLVSLHSLKSLAVFREL